MLCQAADDLRGGPGFVRLPRMTADQPRCAEQPVRLGIAGVGGFARCIADLVQREGGNCRPGVQLVAVAEPDTATHATRLAELRQAGIATFATVDELFARPAIEAIWLPVPIPLHRPFAERALAAGKAVMVEKPAAGTVQDVDAMIAARDRAGWPVAVGFQHMYDPLTLTLKRRLLDGGIGAIQHAVLRACWPRSEQYFRRNNWAGRFKQGDTWVMDSLASNALAHYINLALFLLGRSRETSARPESVEAELYRAHAIENYDTVSLRAQLPGSATLLALMTHACRDSFGPILELAGDKGRVTWTAAGARIETGGAVEQRPACADTGREMLERFARLVRGVPDQARLGSVLETARAQVLLVNAASEAAVIAPVPRDQIARFEQNAEHGVAITGIESAIEQCAARRQMLHESGLLSFTRPAGRLDTRTYRRFAGPRG